MVDSFVFCNDLLRFLGSYVGFSLEYKPDYKDFGKFDFQTAVNIKGEKI